MSTSMTCAAPSVADWEAQQKHASFFQAQLSFPQQAAIASNAAMSILVTLGIAMKSFSGVTGDQDWQVLFVTVIAWMAVTFWLMAGFARSAWRVRARYRSEQVTLFPQAEPYRLESFLLDFADNHAFLFRKELLPQAPPHGAGDPPIQPRRQDRGESAA